MSMCHRHNASIAYIYFDYKNREAPTADYVVRTILKQLLLSLDVIPHDLGIVYNDCFSRSKTPEKAMFMRQLFSVASPFASVYIMLHALDERSDATLQDVIHLVCQLKDSAFKVFCIFRPKLITLGDQLNVLLIHSIHALQF